MSVTGDDDLGCEVIQLIVSVVVSVCLQYNFLCLTGADGRGCEALQ